MIPEHNNFWVENIFFMEIKPQLDEDVIGEVEFRTEQSNTLSNHVWIYLGDLDDILKTRSKSLHVKSERNH